MHIYLDTNRFPAREQYGLSSQIRRSSVSIAANIAEGFSRHGIKEKIQFYHIALGSLTETLSHLYIAHDLEFIDQDELQWYEREMTDLHKMINGMIKKLSERNA